MSRAGEDQWRAGTRLLEAAKGEVRRWERGPRWSTGLPDLDHALGGVEPGDLVVLAARPAMGTTTLALTWTLAAIEQGASALVVAPRLGPGGISTRLVALRQGVSPYHVLRGEVRMSDRDDAWLSSIPLAVQARRVPHVEDLRAGALAHVAAGKRLDLVLVDGLQHLWEPAAPALKALRALADELAVLVLVTCGVTRSVERRRFKAPHPTDLRDARVVLDEADLIATLHRESCFDPDCDEPELAEVSVTSRSEWARRARLRFEPERGRYSSYPVHDLVS